MCQDSWWTCRLTASSRPSISSACGGSSGWSWSIPASRPGDYVLNHVGYAIRRIPEDDIAETLALYEQLLRGASDDEEEDLMAAGVRGEIAAAAGEDRDD